MTDGSLNKPIFDYAEKKYDAHCDADTLLFKCVVVQEKEPCIATHKKSGRSKEFDSFTNFHSWLDENPKWNMADFHVNSVAFAIHNLKKSLETLNNLPFANSVTYYVGGSTNFRRDLYSEYKANRGDKPKLFPYVYDYMIRRKDVVVSLNEEAEDAAACNAFLGTSLSNPHDSSTVLCYIDKDLDMIGGWRYNYNKPELGVFWQDELDAFRCLCEQLLKGDRACDNIKGIDFITDELTKAYKFRKAKSIGDTTAKKLLDDCSTKQELIDRICHIYQLSYGDDNWKQELDFTGKLVYISKYKGVYFDVDKFIKGEL